jgi:hypothetical protein
LLLVTCQPGFSGEAGPHDPPRKGIRRETVTWVSKQPSLLNIENTEETHET